MADILTELGYIFIRQYYVKKIHAYYDLYLPQHNVLIEVDGDHWHCNPNTIHAKPKYKYQKRNLKRDKIKNEWCKKNKIPLLRFWESDINNKPEEVKLELKQYLL